VKPIVAWWRDAGGGPPPQQPLLVMVRHDDPDAVSALPPDHGAAYDVAAGATGRVAADLGVPVMDLGTDLPAHDLLLLGEVGRGLTSLAARMAVGMFGAEPQLVVGHGSGIDDLGWMRKVQAVRDHPLSEPPPCVSATAGLLAASTVPVLLDGVLSAAAAAVAGPGPEVQAPVLGEEPVQRFLLDRADVGVWGLSGIGPGAGLGALAGLATLRLALLAAD
jgi:nicotinate-nucleotide--dimethylbenzimidazole phosphoribosyltransferase